MHMYGFGFPGQGFHCLKIPGPVKQQSNEHQGMIRVEKSGMNESKMDAELLAVFPNKQNGGVFQVCRGDHGTI